MISDFDVWAERPVEFQEILKTMKKNIEKIKKLLQAATPKIKQKRNCLCKTALENAKIQGS
jgi:5'-methylthioadenosine phosphorylase